MSKITITVAGTTLSGKTFIKYQIAKHLSELGFDIDVEEQEINSKGVIERLVNPKRFVDSMKEKGVTIKVEEKQLARDLRHGGEKYFFSKGA